MSKKRTKKILSYILTLIIIGAALAWVCVKFVHLDDVEFTDNAQVNQHISPVNSRVQGYIKEIRFREYEPVRKGDTLVVIDDSDLRLAMTAAIRQHMFEHPDHFGATSPPEPSLPPPPMPPSPMPPWSKHAC